MVSHDDAPGSPNEPNADARKNSAPDAATAASPDAKVETKTSRRGVPRNATQTPARSKKLDRTLKELESAFTGWESLSCPKAAAAEASNEEERLKASLAKEAAATNEEFRKKTKKLLSQLREQLAELND